MGRAGGAGLLIALSALALASSGEGAQANALRTPVASKEKLGPDNPWQFNTNLDVEYGIGWGKKGRGIKKAWARFQAGGTARDCQSKFADDGSQEVDFPTCRDNFGATYSYVTDCTVKGAFFHTKTDLAKRISVPTGQSLDSFTFTKLVPLKFPRPRESCEISAALSAVPPESMEGEDPGPALVGRPRFKVELFVQK